MGSLMPISIWQRSRCGRVMGSSRYLGWCVRRSGLLRLGVLIALLVALCSAWPAPTFARDPSLRLSAPNRVALGAPILITLTAQNVVDLAGYETHVLFDTSAAEFDGIQQRGN